jgi:Flp pilus assembly protein TadD
MTARTFLLLGALGLVGCGGQAREPARAVSEPGLSSSASPADAAISAPVSTEVPAMGDDAARSKAEPSTGAPGGEQVPPPLPSTTKLSRGSGSKIDAALAAGDAAFEADDFASADARYREAAGLGPKDAAPLVGLARVAIAKTNVPTDYNAAPKNPALEKAAAALRQAIKLDPAFAPAYTELGRALLVLGKADDALATLRKAIELAPRDPEAHSGLGVALLATGRSDPAVTELAKAAELDPGSAPRQTNLGTALLMRGRVTEAVRAYELAARIAPKDARTLSDLGTALLADNQVDRAIAALKRALAVDAQRATLHSNLGYALQQKRDVPGAIAEFREAIRLDEKLVSAWINLATALAQTGDLVEARRALVRAQKLDPSDPRVRANLDELRELEKKGRPGTKPDAGR